jgi:leucyl-tRNA synthetase
MHSTDPDTANDMPSGDTPPFRYTGALANDIEARWQDRWEAEGTFDTPNPAGPLGDPAAVAGRPKKFVLDMFPYPSAAPACTWATRWASSAPTSTPATSA